MFNKNLLVSIVFLFKALKVNFLGTISGSELVIVILLPFLNISKVFYKYKLLRVTALLLLMLFFSQVLSDILNYNELYNSVRGCGSILLTLITTSCYVYLFDKNTKGVLFSLFFTSLSVLAFGPESDSYNSFEIGSDFIKLVIVGVLNPLVLLLSYRLGLKKSFYIYFGYAAISIFIGARSNALAFLFSSVFILISERVRKGLNARFLLMLSLFALLVLYGLYLFYIDLVLTSDFGGKNAINQIMGMSNQFNIFELLILGRPEIYSLFEAIKANPFFGHGSWAPDPYGLFDIANFVDGHATTKEEFVGFIHAHSVILGYWAYAGLGGFVSIALIFYLFFKYSFKFVFFYPTHRLSPIVLVVTFEMLWALFFSPLSVMRNQFPFWAALVICNYSSISNKSIFKL